MINNILISKDKRKILHRDTRYLGVSGENLQEILIFNLDEDIVGQGIIEIELPDGYKGFVEIERTERGYELPVKSSLLTQSGTVKIQLRILQSGQEVFKSEIMEFIVKEAINATETIPEQYPTWIDNLETLKARLENAESERVANENERISNEDSRIANEEERQTNYTNIKQKVANGEFNGATYMPNVDKDGNITWTNDKGLENPSAQNIRGPQGIQGPQGEAFKIKKTYPSIEAMQNDFDNMEVGDYVMIATSIELEDNAKLYARTETEWIFITDFSGATGIQGPQGIQGMQGVQGERGIGIIKLEVKQGYLYVTLTDNTTQNAGLIITDEVKQWLVTEITNNAESAFNQYYDAKVSDFNKNVETQTKAFNDNAQNKITEYDEHVGEYITRLNDVETLVGDINTVLDYTNGEVI